MKTWNNHCILLFVYSCFSWTALCDI